MFAFVENILFFFFDYIDCDHFLLVLLNFVFFIDVPVCSPFINMLAFKLVLEKITSAKAQH